MKRPLRIPSFTLHAAALVTAALLAAVLAPAQTAAAATSVAAPQLSPSASVHAAPPSPAIVAGKQALATKQFLKARKIFAAALKAQPNSIDAQLGLADSELGLHEYETAEIEYRKVAAEQPELWAAHKNLVIVEAALGRWSEFDRERAILRDARERGAPGISARESDIIDSFTVAGKRWIVRQYFEPAGRSETRYNFEHFSPTGRAQEYISLESEAAAKSVEPGGAIAIGAPTAPGQSHGDFALNWYTGKAHGTITAYKGNEPAYEKVRAAVIEWLRHKH